MVHNVRCDEVFYKFTTYAGEVCRSLMLWVVSTVLHVDGCYIDSAPVSRDVACFDGVIQDDCENSPYV